jgi:putative copper export protein
MDVWTLIRFGHVVGIAFFVGGQLVLVAAVAPQLRARHPEAMRAIARRFGMGSALALGLIIGTGIAMASRYERWDDPVLHAKLAVLVLVGILMGLHVVSSSRRAISLALMISSLVIVWLGVELAHG